MITLEFPNDNFDNPQQQFLQSLTTIFIIPNYIFDNSNNNIDQPLAEIWQSLTTILTIAIKN